MKYSSQDLAKKANYVLCAINPETGKSYSTLNRNKCFALLSLLEARTGLSKDKIIDNLEALTVGMSPPYASVRR